MKTLSISPCNLRIPLFVDSLLVESPLQCKNSRLFLRCCWRCFARLLLHRRQSRVVSRCKMCFLPFPRLSRSSFRPLCLCPCPCPCPWTFPSPSPCPSSSSASLQILSSISAFFLAATAASSMIGLQNALSLRWEAQT